MSLNLNINEIVMLLIGAGIGLISSIFVMIAERYFDKKGKLNIFYRFTNQKGMENLKWGFHDEPCGNIGFIIPVIYEIQNTSNITRVIRDVSLNLYNENRKIKRMLQLNSVQVTSRTGKEIKSEKDYYFGSQKGSYSFVISPRSIERFECEYFCEIKTDDIGENYFNRIYLHYYDEKNKLHKIYMRKIDNAWNLEEFPVDEEWILLK